MRIVTAVLAIASGLIVLFGYFFPEQLSGLRELLVNWAIIIAGMAVLVGIANLVFVQMEKVRARDKNSVYGGVLVISLIFTFGLGLVFGLDHSSLRVVVNAVIIPVEASLLAILAAFNRPVHRHQPVARIFKCEPVNRRIAARQLFLEKEIIEMPVQQRAVHIQQHVVDPFP